MNNHNLPSIAPYYVKRAEEFIRSNAHLPLTIGTIAKEIGISVRSLQRSFRDFREITPMQYLKHTRLNYVHDELTHMQTRKISIGEIALRWGFHHLGHFANHYKRVFGETPVQTLRKSN
ncbi:MAG: helix-turn-helix transcriptional regulator [Proteobacteria bacterium]|nr:helix-turn-helix transcriptional regulator [Pseudomonadota bacterium]